MKTAIAVPDDEFRAGERIAERLGWSRSRLYTEALREFLQRQDADPVTAALNELAEHAPDGTVPVDGSTTARQLIRAGDWEW